MQCSHDTVYSHSSVDIFYMFLYYTPFIFTFTYIFFYTLQHAHGGDEVFPNCHSLTESGRRLPVVRSNMQDRECQSPLPPAPQTFQRLHHHCSAHTMQHSTISSNSNITRGRKRRLGRTALLQSYRIRIPFYRIY